MDQRTNALIWAFRVTIKILLPISKSYRNVVCSLNVGRADRVIVGAHYDVFGDQDGADDNASGVAGVIETARILAEQKSKLPNNVDFVFYSLEEPPFSKN